MTLRNRWLMVATAGAALAAAASLNAWASDTARGSFERTLTVSGRVDLTVVTGSGDIVVRAGKSGTIHIRGKIETHGDWSGSNAEARVQEIESNPPIEQDGNRVKIGGHDNDQFFHNVSIDYEIEAPADTRLVSRSRAGDLTVEGIGGPVEAESGSGDLKFSSISGSIRARTGSGNVKLDGIKAESVEIETGSGDVELSRVECGLRVQTGSGDISAEGDPTEEWHLEASSGGIRVHLPADKGFDVDAHTGSGDVSTALPVTVRTTTGHGEWRGQLRGGGVMIHLRTGSGDIRID